MAGAMPTLYNEWSMWCSRCLTMFGSLLVMSTGFGCPKIRKKHGSKKHYDLVTRFPLPLTGFLPLVSRCFVIYKSLTDVLSYKHADSNKNHFLCKTHLKPCVPQEISSPVSRRAPKYPRLRSGERRSQEKFVVRCAARGLAQSDSAQLLKRGRLSEDVWHAKMYQEGLCTSSSKPIQLYTIFGCLESPAMRCLFSKTCQDSAEKMCFLAHGFVSLLLLKEDLTVAV